MTHCTTRHATPVIAIQPGREPLCCVGITYARGTPDVAWCERCWWARFGADLFSMPGGRA